MPDVIGIRGYFSVKKPLRKFWYTGTCYEPGYTSFPPIPEFRGHNSEKMWNRAGIIHRFPTGTDGVEYSNVTKTKSRIGVVQDVAGIGRGYPGILPGKHQG